MLRFATNKHSRFFQAMSTLQKSSLCQKSLLGSPKNVGRRYMGGHGAGADISMAEGIGYIVVVGTGISVWGLYKTIQMRERIEAFETGQIISHKSLTDEEFFKFKKEFARLHGAEEEDDDDDESQILQENEEDSKYPNKISKSDKDTVIFIDAPED